MRQQPLEGIASVATPGYCTFSSRVPSPGVYMNPAVPKYPNYRPENPMSLLQGGSGAAATPEDHFRQALDWARRQGALSLELRAATSFARLLRDQGRPADAMALLQLVDDRFTEGFDTTDLQTAKALIDALL